MPQTFVLPRQTALDDDANPLAGALLYFFQTGTTTPQAVYSDIALTTPHANPIVADSAGEWPKIYLNSAANSNYRVRITTAAGVQLYQEDDIDRFTISNAEVARALYPQTSAELAANAVPVNYAIPSHEACGYAIVERYANNTDPGTTDMTAAVQAAVNVGLSAQCDVAVNTMCRLIGSVNIDRQVDGAAFDAHFTIRGYGGGFYVTSEVNMFSSTIPFSTSPVSQLVRWKDIRFEASGTGYDAYVLHDARFLRSEFVGCDFVKIKCLYAPTVITQSLYFFHCNMRRWTGAFYHSLNTNFDTKFHGCLAEAGDNFAIMAFPVGSSFVQNTIEGMDGTCIRAYGAQGLVISGNYFEFSEIDCDFRQDDAEANYGIILQGNYFSHDPAEHVNDYAVLWGDTNNSVSEGNYFTDNAHEFYHSTNRPRINDISITGPLTNLPGGQTQFIPAANIPAFAARSAQDQSITTSTFTKITFGTEDYDTNGNFATSAFAPTVAGIYEFAGTVYVTGTSITRVAIALYKNGTEVQRLHDVTFGAQSSYIASVAGSVTMNGSTDTMELWVYVVATSPVVEFVSAAETSRFSASLVRNI